MHIWPIRMDTTPGVEMPQLEPKFKA